MRMRRLFFFLALAPAWLLLSQPRPASVPKADAGEVTLPLAEYENLLRQVAPPEPPPEPAPILSAAVLTLSAGDDVVRAELKFSARSEKAKPSELALGGDWPAETQSVTPESAILARRGESLSLLLPGAGTWQVILKASVPLDHAGDLAKFRLPIPNFSAVEGTLSVGFANAGVTLSGATILSRKTAGGKTVVGFAASPGELSGSIRAAGGKKSGPLKFGPAFVSAEEHVEESFLRSVSSVRIGLESGKAESVEFAIPADCEVLSVHGDAVAGFESKGGRLSVRLGAPATAESPGIHLQIALSRKFEPGRFQPPFPLFATPSTYVLAFYPSETLELSMEEAGAFEDAEPGSTETAGITGGADDLLIARAAKSPVPPTYSCEKRKEGKVLAVTIPEARFTTVASERGGVVTAAEYLVQSRSKAVLRVLLPAGAEFWEADVVGRPVVVGRDAEGGLLLPLSSSSSKNRLRVLYSIPSAAWKPRAKWELVLPAAAAPISRASWAVTLPDDWEASVPKDSAWRESGAPAPVAASEDRAASRSDEDQRFIESNRVEAVGSKRSARGIVVGLPEGVPRRFAASLLQGTPPPLVLELKKQKRDGGWR